MNNRNESLTENGAVTLTDHQWQEARRRAAIIRPLAAASSISQRAAEEAGRKLSLSARTIYTLVRAWRLSEGSVPVLVPIKPSGGRGRARLAIAVEAIIGEAVEHVYLTAQKPRLSRVLKAVRRRCRISGLKVPSVNTIQARINELKPTLVVTRREGRKAAHRLTPAAGVTPPARAPLEVIQMDHTTIERHHRRPGVALTRRSTVSHPRDRRVQSLHCGPVRHARSTIRHFGRPVSYACGDGQSRLARADRHRLYVADEWQTEAALCG